MAMGDVTSGLSLAIALGALTVLYVLFRDYKVDKVRDDLFALRDELFDYAWEHKLFEHGGYTKLRIIMNAMLRYAHKLTFARLLLTLLLLRATRPRANPYMDWRVALGTLPREQAKTIEEFHAKMSM